MEPVDIVRPDGILCRLFLNKENMPLLEHLIEQAHNEWVERIRLVEPVKDKKLLRPVDREDLTSLCHEVKEHVDDLLGTHDLGFPSYSYINPPENKFRETANVMKGASISVLLGSIITSSLISLDTLAAGIQPRHLVYLFPAMCLGMGYASNKLSDYFSKKYRELKNDKDNTFSARYHSIPKHITFKRGRPKYIMLAIIGHEYAHHVQYEKIQPFVNLNYQYFGSFVEGHAIGISRNIAKLRADKEESYFLAYTYEMGNRLIPRLIQTYRWFAQKQGIEINNSLLKKICNLDPEQVPIIEPDKYGKGETIFHIAESCHGTGIYKDAIEMFYLE